MSDTSVCRHIIDTFDASGRPYQRLDHAEARSADDAAAARGTALAIGGKSVLMKVERLGDVIVVVGSDRRVDGKRLRRALGVQRYRFATEAELLALAGLTPGAVPAFGRPCLDAELVVGDDVLLRDEIVFAAGSSRVSIRVSVADWLAVARPRVVPCFTELRDG